MLIHPWDAAHDAEWKAWLSGHDVSATEAPDKRLLPGIRGIELTVTGVRAKFKFGGNKAPGDRSRIGAELERRGDPQDAGALAQLARRER